MKKRFLLTAGNDYYPNRADADWVEFFETREEAEKCIEPEGYGEYRITLPSGHYTFVDWYRIIDFEEWENNIYDCYHVWHEPEEASE